MSEKRKLTLDPIREIEMTVKIREVESTIAAGFKIEWMSGEEPSIGEYALYAGAGVGSRWLTMHVAGKEYAVDMAEFFQRFIAEVAE